RNTYIGLVKRNFPYIRFVTTDVGSHITNEYSQMKNIYIILGNGFTLDFLNSIGKLDEINARNLFKNGEKVPWPGNNQSGFLSYKYCPNLWNLGARPNSDSNQTIELIEDIITCANILQKNN